jgi:hypothetical protein
MNTGVIRYSLERAALWISPEAASAASRSRPPNWVPQGGHG